MTKFIFDISLVNSLQASDKKIVEKFGIKEEGGMTITLFPQYFYEVTTVSCRDKVTLERKVADELIKIPVLARCKGNNPDPKKLSARAAIKMGESIDPKAAQLVVWETKRETYKVDLLTETIYPKKSHQYQKGQIVKHGKFDWIVRSIEHDPIKSTEKVSKTNTSERLFVNDFFGGRLITKVRELKSPVNHVIYLLCKAQNEGKACISGQLHKTVKALHASREPNRPQVWSQAVYGADKHPDRRNKLQEIEKLFPGDYTEEVYFDDEGKYLGRDLHVVKDSSHKGWSEATEFVEIRLDPADPKEGALAVSQANRNYSKLAGDLTADDYDPTLKPQSQSQSLVSNFWSNLSHGAAKKA